MNSCCLVGNIVRDFDISWHENTCIAKSRLAVGRKFGEGTDYIPITAFGKTAELCEKYLSKGKKIGVVGEIRTGSYKGKNGETVYTTEVIVENIEFLSQKNDKPKVDEEVEDTGFREADNDIPF